MPRELVSRKARQELREYFVGYTLREIADEFDAAEIKCDADYEPAISGQRRTLVEQYYHSLDFTDWSDVRRFLSLYANVLAHLEAVIAAGAQGPAERYAPPAFHKLKSLIERDGFLYDQGALRPTEGHHQLSSIAHAAGFIDAPELHRQIERLRNAVVDDPALAVGTAKELVESTCKTILRERRVSVDEAWDLSRLVKETRAALKLLPEDVPSAARGAEAIRRLLSNLGSVAQGLAELRNLYGTGHGRDGAARGILPRHAKLAVGSATTLATFLLETHEARS